MKKMSASPLNGTQMIEPRVAKGQQWEKAMRRRRHWWSRKPCGRDDVTLL